MVHRAGHVRKAPAGRRASVPGPPESVILVGRPPSEAGFIQAMPAGGAAPGDKEAHGRWWLGFAKEAAHG